MVAVALATADARLPATMLGSFPTRLPTPADRTRPPGRVARVCMHGHLVAADLPPSAALGAATNRADPLAVATTDVACPTCAAGTILACPGCGYPIPGATPPLAYDVPHFCVVCGEYYPWTFRGEFYATLAEILEGSARLDLTGAHEALHLLERQQEGLATLDETRRLTQTFRALGGSDWDLAAQILQVVLSPEERAPLDLRAAFSH